MIRKIRHYTVLSELGAGGMGRVFLAHDERADRQVALKFLSGPADDAEARAALSREARAAARLSHPGIVTLFAVEEEAGELFLVQEYIRGETLSARVAREPLSVPEGLRLGRELAAALDHAHRNGVLHRDLKPDNILVTADGHYKIADFGIARLEDTTTLGGADLQAGTLAYMAPERFSGHPGDARSDLFALGAILHEALSGRRAFAGRTAAELMMQILNEAPPALALPGDSGAALAALVARLLRRDPLDRPAGAEEVRGTLDALATPGGATALTAMPGAAAPATTATAGATLTGGASSPSGARPAGRGGRIALVVALVAVLAAAAWLLPRLRAGAPGGGTAERAPVAVLYFDNLADPADPQRVGAITGNLLVTSLAQAGELDVLSSQTILDALAQLGKPGAKVDRNVAMQVARKVRAGRIVTGTILQTTPFLVVTAEITDVKSGRVLQASRVEGQPGQTVFDLVDRMGGQLVTRLAGLPEGTKRLEPVATRTSTDLAAMRHHVDGMDALASGDTEGALKAFHAAVAADSTFAQAWYQGAIAQWWQGEPEAAREEIERARRYADRLAPGERGILDGLGELIAYDYPHAAARFEELARRYPEDRMVRYGLVEAEFHNGRYREAIQAARATLAIDPNFALASVHLADACYALGQAAAGDSTLADLTHRFPRNFVFWQSLTAHLLSRGRGVEALAAWRRALAAGLPDYPARFLAGRVALALDSVDAARQLWDRDLVPPEMRRDARLGFENQVALHEGRLRDAVRAARAAFAEFSRIPHPLYPVPLADGIQAALDRGDERLAYEMADSVQACLLRFDPATLGPVVGTTHVFVDVALGHLPEAKRRLQALEAAAPSGHPVVRPTLDFMWAQWWLESGQPDSTLRLLPRSLPLVSPEDRQSFKRLLRVRALEAAGRPTEALALLDTLQGAAFLPPSEAVRLNLRRGRLLEALKRTAEARAAYERLLALWAHADADAPGLREAREAVKRLGAAGG